jgi:signal transduction histidine kinase/HPt (histidine-containing phosphotransfer) domain-containing protein/ActR/RegA family two-component response regulator
MTAPRPEPSARLFHPSVYGLLGLALASMLAVLGVEMLFNGLQDELQARSANERARQFVGDEIVRGIQGIERNMYRMVATTSNPGVARIQADIDELHTKLMHDLGVLKDGGTARRVLLLNIGGKDDMTLAATYQPGAEASGYVMELIELAPLIDQIQAKAHGLEDLLVRRHDCTEREDSRCLIALLPEISLYLKQLPPFFERLGENANRLFADGNARLKELEIQLAERGEYLKKVELGLVALVMILTGLIGVAFLRRLQQANEQLERAVNEMRVAKEQAEQASRAKSEFVSRMSHELRTPLNAILGFAQLLEDEPLEPEHHEYVGLINKSGQHLMELINAVLDHAKIESGSLSLEGIAFNFPDCVEAVRAMVSERAAAKGLAFEASIAADLPRYILGDPTRLRQVLINLLSNAIKFTEQGSVELRVAVEDGRIVFSVRDTGIGMDAATQARLFQPFSQGDVSITRKYGGTGLGLMIAKELIEAMGGGIEVESAPGVGTVFWFWLPLRVANAPETAAAAAPTAPETLRIPGRVLLVDDNRVNQHVASAMLGRLGIAHECADNGIDALVKLAAGDYALVLMDMEMPEMDGVTATREIRALEASRGAPRLPIVAMTANALREDRERCFAAGMDGYIAKPVTLTSLRDELGRHFGGPAAPALAEPEPAAAADGPLFDRAAAVELMGDDEDIFKEVARTYVADTPALMRELETALAGADLAALARAGHTLKGLFATFAAPAGAARARQLEMAARDGDVVACAALAPDVRARAEALAEALAGE